MSAQDCLASINKDGRGGILSRAVTAKAASWAVILGVRASEMSDPLFASKLAALGLKVDDVPNVKALIKYLARVPKVEHSAVLGDCEWYEGLVEYCFIDTARWLRESGRVSRRSVCCDRDTFEEAVDIGHARDLERRIRRD